MSAEKLTNEILDEKIATVRPRELRYIDPMKLAQWTIETAIQMVDGAVAFKTIDRAIKMGDLEAFHVGQKITVDPAKFLTWYKRHRK